VTKAMSAEDKTRYDKLSEALKRILKPAPLPMTMVLQSTNGPPPKTFVLARGDYNNPGDEVQPGYPAILCASRGNEALLKSEMESSVLTSAAAKRRAALAQWIASPDNPLTARVMVNRIWQHHFGRGLVATPSDLGTHGARPTHPELLDWLAGEFASRGWSIKAMHKLILMSAAYQQSTEPSAEALAHDSNNELFSRQNRIRLEGEAIRDSLLAISGRLNYQIGGPSVSPPIPSDITRTSKNWTTSPNAADHARRSIYLLARRNLRFPFLEVFDAPDSNLTCPERGHSTTAPQSLTLLNSDEVMNAATATAERLLKQAKSSNEQIQLAFRLALGRRPAAKELTMAREFLQTSKKRRETAQTPDVRQTTSQSSYQYQELTPLRSPAEGEWTELCRALLNLNAFVYVD